MLNCLFFLFDGQLRNKLNQDQNSKLQQQRENLNKRNLEVAAMDKRINELRDRLWKKKAALQQKENLPVSVKDTTAALKNDTEYPHVSSFRFWLELMKMVLISPLSSGLRVKAIFISLYLRKPQMPWHSEQNITNVRLLRLASHVWSPHLKELTPLFPFFDLCIWDSSWGSIIVLIMPQGCIWGYTPTSSLVVCF